MWNNEPFWRGEKRGRLLELGEHGRVGVFDLGEFRAQRGLILGLRSRGGRGQGHPVEQCPEWLPVAAVGDYLAQGSAGLLNEGAQPLHLVVSRLVSLEVVVELAAYQVAGLVLDI